MKRGYAVSMEKKYQVFISSTYTDLAEARSAVRDAILSMYHFPVGMELFGAANEEQWQIIAETIDSSDYYVLIVGQRYGTVITEGSDAGISYTEKEFRYALEHNIPILAFLLDDSVPVKPENMEKDYPEKLTAFKEFVKKDRLVDWWKNTDELAQKVTSALYKQITRTKRPGWIRGDSVDIEKSLKTITDLTERVQELTDENKNLLLENQALKQKPDRKPKLTISIIAEEPNIDEADDPLYERAENISTDDEGCVHLKVGTVGTGMIEADYQPISKEDFHFGLQGQVTDAEIEKYNDALPKKEILDAYLDEYKAYHMIQECGITTIFVINNMGTAKATDVSVKVEFPDDILVFDIDDVRNMPEPEAPKKPRDLHEIAYERAHKSEIAIERMYSQLEQLNRSDTVNWPTLAAVTTGNNTYEPVEIEDSIVEIEPNQGIVHTKSDYFGGIYLVPLKKGEFKAKVTLMCAEYEDPQELDLNFLCE